ncbi:hypothetical protein CCB80_03105 [Armatimonadetes bacterium Uphvl-Ar1]|nr:hypothetical protein CCB80_03105 [Armatimonadetes bacterium Uphvl-Ar1]
MTKFEEHPGRAMSLPGGFVQLRPSDVVHLIMRECQKSSQKTVAEQIGISPQYLSDILKGRREISTAVAEKLGLERVVTFVRWGDE